VGGAVTATTTSPLSISNMTSIPIPSAGTYLITFEGNFTSTATTTGCRLRIVRSTGTCTYASGFLYGFNNATTTSSANLETLQVATTGTFDSTLVTTGVSATATQHSIGIKLIVTFSGIGGFTINFASETGTSVTLQAGSIASVTKLS